jgi:hypothetical protein
MAVQSSIGTRIKIATAQGASKVISGITKASPAVVTSTGHGLSVGTVVLITGVVGMTEVNSRAFVITAQTTNGFTLGGCDSSGYTAYASDGTAVVQTMTEVVGPTGWERAGTPAAEIDATAMADTSIVRLSGMPDRGSVTMPVIISTTDPGQAAVRKAVGGAPVARSIPLPDGKMGSVMVSWNNFTDKLGLQSPHAGEFSAYVSADYAWYA